MMKPIACLALLMLAACGGRAAPEPAIAETPAQAECRAEARQSPDVAALSRRVLLGVPASEYRFRRDRQQAEATAYTNCLQRRGLSRGGGVEPLRRPGF